VIDGLCVLWWFGGGSKGGILVVFGQFGKFLTEFFGLMDRERMSVLFS
jgi:hypothetical protein